MGGLGGGKKKFKKNRGKNCWRSVSGDQPREENIVGAEDHIGEGGSPKTTKKNPPQPEEKRLMGRWGGG